MWLVSHSYLIKKLLPSTSLSTISQWTGAVVVEKNKMMGETELVGFGEKVLYKLPTKGPHSNPEGNVGTRWKEGIYLGHSVTSNVHIMASTILIFVG